MGVARRLLAVAVLLMSACGDDVGPLDAGDASTDAALDAMVFTPTAPAPPVAPALPSFGACPAGWSAVDVEGAVSCEPWGEAWMGCGDGEARFVGDEACAPLGSPCPADGWPADLPAGATVHHVQAGASAGDGSRATPFGTLGEASAVAAAGDVIAVGTGTYVESFTIEEGVSVIGACAEATVIDGPPGTIADAAVWMRAGTELRDVTVAGGRPGIRAVDGEAQIADVVVQAAIIGLVGTETAVVLAERLVVRDIATGGEYGLGIFVNRDARLELRRSIVERSTSVGVGLDDAGSSALLEDVVIRDVMLRAGTGEFGNGVAVTGGGSVTLRRVLVERARGAGVFVRGGSTGVLDTVVVRDIDSDTLTGATGYGLGVGADSSLDADRVHLERTTTAAIFAAGFRSTMSVRDLVVEVVASEPADGRGGVGMLLDSVAPAGFERVLTVDTKGTAIAIINPDTDVEMTDVTVVAPAAEESGELGVAAAIDMRGGASLDVVRMRAADAVGGAIIASEPGTRLAIADLFLSGVSPTPAGVGGRGVSSQAGAEFSCTRCAIEDCAEVAVIALGPAGAVTLRDARITATTPNPLNGAGMGVVSIEGPTVDIERFVVSDHAVAGLQLVASGPFVARDGLISGNPVGVNSQRGTVDPADLSDRVVYRDNGINFDGAALPVPSGGL